MHRGTAELIASGQAKRAKRRATRRPNSASSIPTAYRLVARSCARGPLVVSFYRGVWCPYCNLELQALQDALPEITERGASLVAI